MKQPNADTVDLSALYHCTFGMEYTGAKGETIDNYNDRKEKLGNYILTSKWGDPEIYMLRLMRMKNPSDIPVFADTITKPGAEYTTYCRFKYKKFPDQGVNVGMVMAHSGRNPIAFADGHAASHTGKELSTMPYQLDEWFEDTNGAEGKK